MFFRLLKKAITVLMLICLQACSYAPELNKVGKEQEKVLLQYSYGKLLLQIHEQGIDSKWFLDISKTTITINGSIHQVVKAERQKYISQQNGFAYNLYILPTSKEEGEHILNVVVSKVGESKSFRAKYKMNYEFKSIFHYFYAIYKQRSSWAKQHNK